MCSSSNHDGWNMWGNGMKWTDDFEWRAMIGIVFEFEESLSACRHQFETLRLLPVLFNFILKWFAFSNIQFNGLTFDNDPQRHSHPAVWRKFAMPSYHHIDISAFHLIHILVPNGNIDSTIHPPKLHDSAFLKLNLCRSFPFEANQMCQSSHIHWSLKLPIGARKSSLSEYRVDFFLLPNESIVQIVAYLFINQCRPVNRKEDLVSSSNHSVSFHFILFLHILHHIIIHFTPPNCIRYRVLLLMIVFIFSWGCMDAYIHTFN